MKHDARMYLEGSDLVKDFGNGRGVFGISLTVARGEIVGFVGPNGAGKSTTINMLTGFIKPDKGSFTLFGRAIDYTSIYTVMPRIGVLFSEQTIPNELSAAHIFAQNEELLRRDCREQWQQMSQYLQLDTTKKVKKLSLGNKKKVGVILALMHQPELLIMDEPTAGLDPLIRSQFMQMLRERANAGAAVLLSSHDLGEIQQICDRIMMIKAGKVILMDTTENILDKTERTFRLVRPPANLMKKLSQIFPGLTIQKEGNEAIMQVGDYQAMLSLLTTAGFYNFYVERASLETAFKENYR